MIPQNWVMQFYDRETANVFLRRYYDHSGFLNLGYWDGQVTSQREASEALVDKLLDKIPQKTGRILDVACGLGATTKHLLGSYAPHMVTAVNFSEAQIAEARKRAPECKFHYMDATRLDFPDAHFDAVICVEAAFHFETRDTFLRETMRVLKSGGWLVLSDILFRNSVASLVAQVIPRSNLVTSIESYRQRFEEAGFRDIGVEDATKNCLAGYCSHIVRWPASEFRCGRMSLAESIAGSLRCQIYARLFRGFSKTYLLASARKP